MAIFGSSLEKDLRRTYEPLLGYRAAKELIKSAKMALKRDPSIAQRPMSLPELDEEGVTHADYEQWWALQPLERAVMLTFDEVTETQMLFDFGDQGLEPAEAVAQVRRSLPIFGDPRHPGEYQSEDDRPLPRELKNRVSAAAAMLATNVTDRHTSMNAVVREAIRAGRI